MVSDMKYPNRLPGDNSVLVLGKVEKPGEILMAMDHSLQGHRRCGRAGAFRDSHRVAVWKCRDGWLVPVDLKDVLEKKPGAKDPVLEGGDVVIVMEKSSGSSLGLRRRGRFFGARWRPC